MRAEDTHEVAVVLHLRVPKAVPERHIERLRMALVTVAADMDHVIEAGVGPSTPDLLVLHDEVLQAGAVIRTIDYGSVFGGMTCTEAEALAGVFAAAGDQATHDHIITSHGHGDDDPEDRHHNIYEEAHRERT